MLQHQKRSIPLWVYEHRGCRAQISSLLSKLQDIPECNRLPDYLARSIEVNPLDYHTGVTSPSVTPYFGRRFDLALKKKADLTKVYRLFRKADDCFGSEKDTKLCQAVAHEIDVQVGRHYRELEFVNKAPYEWTDLS